MNYVIIIFLLTLSALFSGLNLGLMSLGPHELKRKIKLGNKKAAKVYQVRKNGNLLLVTLLLGNVAVNAVLSVFLGSITVGVVAVVVSTALITLFGEIIPQAILSRYALDIGARLVWLVKIFMFLLYPITKPISSVLDKALGEEMPTIYSKKELVNVLEEHGDNGSSDLQAHEEKIARGALLFGDRKVRDIMTPRSIVYNLKSDTAINSKLIKSVSDSGYSRIPVIEGGIDNIAGILYSHDLLTIFDKKDVVVAEVIRKAHYLNEAQSLDEALRAFLKTRNHLFVVINEFREFVGVISMEDILEEILQEEIMDEFDKYDDLRAVAAHRAKM